MKRTTRTRVYATLFLLLAAVPAQPASSDMRKVFKPQSSVPPSTTTASGASASPTPLSKSKKARATSSAKREQTTAPVPDESDEFDDFEPVPSISDPIEPINRGVFWLNHQLYTYLLRPVSKVYTTVLPKPVRRAVNNVYDNVEYPVRLTNHVLQGDLRDADLETRKFVVNSVGGIGGILKLSDRYPSLAAVPRSDTGQTLGKWGIAHGPYLVIPVLGPRSVRDTVGLVGDTALNPVSWIPFAGAGPAIAVSISTPNTVRNTHNRFEIYDAATRDALDPYLAIRSGYIQNRDRPKSKPQTP